jgi:inner membrane protein
MPTIFTHAVVPLAAGLGLGKAAIPRRLLGAGMFMAILPDVDVAGFQLGVSYGTALAHRGFTHSLAAAALVALAGASAWRCLGTTFGRAFVFLFGSMASHGLLDACTNGGSGIALLWPFSDTRFFSPFAPIEVSPIGVSRFLSARGAAVMASEMVWVWLPCALLAALLWRLRRQSRR